LKLIRLSIVAVFLYLAAPAPSIAGADGSFSFSIRGPGAISCGAYVRARENGNATAYEQFWLGYATAYNESAPKTYDILGGVDPDGSFLWLENYCREKPLELFFDAIQALLPVLQPNRLTKSPK